VRNHLHRGAGVIAPPLLVDDGLVDASRGDVVGLAQGTVDESLIVAEIQIGLRPIVRHEHLAMLEGRHGPGIDVDVRVELEHRHREPALHEQAPEGRRHDSLAERGDHAAGHENVLGGMLGTGHCETS